MYVSNGNEYGVWIRRGGLRWSFFKDSLSLNSNPNRLFSSFPSIVFPNNCNRHRHRHNQQMADTDMPPSSVDLDGDIDPSIRPVQVNVQPQDSVATPYNQHFNDLTLSTDVPMSDVQPPSEDHKPIPSAHSNGNDGTEGKVPQQKLDDMPYDKPSIDSNTNDKLPQPKFEDRDRILVEPQPGIVTPLPHKKYSSHKPKQDSLSKSKSIWADAEMGEVNESGTPEERAAFMKELETFCRENALEFKPPKFYGEPLNCLKLWRAVIKLGGYEVVTTSKLWRQVGESFHPPKTCTTVSWTFRNFYEKALLEYEKHKRQIGELQLPGSPMHQSTSANAEKETSAYQPPGLGRERRVAATRAMQGWHAQRLVGYGEISEPIIKDKNLNSATKREKPLKSIGIHKQRASNMDPADKHESNEADKELVAEIVDIGPPANWVKINVHETKDCYEVYALVPGLLREEVRVQSDPAGRLVITGQPEQLDNPWGITPFRKVVVLPSRIDPLHTSAIVSLHGRLHVRVPFEQLSG